jgi:membrane-associated protease RseP (regulator of RpoE activity)
MFLFLPTRGTPYDLRFSLFGIPVTVTPFFWVVAAILGWDWLSVGPANLLAWVLCVFVSILVHEFGHAFTMRGFGHDPEVVLHHFGGYATFRGRETPGKSLLISAAGPGVQLALWAVLEFAAIPWLARSGQLPEHGTPLYTVLVSMRWINFSWAILNLLPVFPLDGGRMLGAVFALVGLRRANEWTLRVGVFVGTLIAVLFLVMLGNFLMGAMFAFMAMENYQMLKGQRFQVW